MKAQRQQQLIWMIVFNSALFVAMLLAEGLKATEVPPVSVVFLSVVLAGCLSVIVALELVVNHLARPKR